MSDSIVFLPQLLPEAARWLDICNRWCAAHGYPIVGVVHTWDAAVGLVMDGRAELLVAGRRDHLPIDRSPRLEIVTEQPMLPVPIARRRTGRCAAGVTLS